MLITNFKHHLIKPIKGCIHIGAHHAEEKNIYKQYGINNIIWIDANPDYEEIIKNNTNNEDLVIIRGIGNKKRKVNFNISNNGQSSSILELGTHKNEHPHIFYTNQIEISEDRMVDIVDEFKINIDNYNFLNLDIQGYEMEAIKGFEDLISKFDYIYSEVNINYLYENCSLISDIDNYLQNYSFVRVETSITHHGWGDALYIKK
jgi:FkbM family methyltransferase